MTDKITANREILDASAYDAKKLRKVLSSIKKTATMVVKVSNDDRESLHTVRLLLGAADARSGRDICNHRSMARVHQIHRQGGALMFTPWLILAAQVLQAAQNYETLIKAAKTGTGI